MKCTHKRKALRGKGQGAKPFPPEGNRETQFVMDDACVGCAHTYRDEVLPFPLISPPVDAVLRLV